MRSATARLPVAGFLQFADFSLDHVAPEHAEVRDKKDAVQVIGLVAECAGQQSFAAHLELFARGILRANRDVLRTRDVAPKPRYGKAAFLFALFALGIQNLRICADNSGFRILSVASISFNLNRKKARFRLQTGPD